MFYKLNKKIGFISTLAVVAFLSANVNAEDKLINSNIKIGVEKDAAPKLNLAIEKPGKESPIKIEIKETTTKKKVVETKEVKKGTELLGLPKISEKAPAPKLDNDPLALDLDLDLDLDKAPSLEIEAKKAPALKIKKIDKEIEEKKAENKDLDDAVKNILADIEREEKNEGVKDDAPVGLLGLNENLIDNLKGTVFAKMSNLEKQNALLDLELKQEKIKNEIEALKQKRKNAVIQTNEKLKKAQAERFKLQQEEERKTLVEKQKLADKEIEVQKQAEEKKLNAYKLELIQEKNLWIEKYNDIYKKLKQEKDTKIKMVNNMQKLLVDVTKTSSKANSEAKKAKAIYEARLKKAKKTEALLRAELKKKNSDNPFATPSALLTEEKDMTPASQAYAIMEIRGQGNELVAQLLNKSGKSFYVKSGTLLKTGHVVTEIGKNYVRLGFGKSFETLYFAAGGILDKEPEDVKKAKSKPTKKTTSRKAVKAKRNYTVTSGVPGMNKGMLVK